MTTKSLTDLKNLKKNQKVINDNKTINPLHIPLILTTEKSDFLFVQEMAKQKQQYYRKQKKKNKKINLKK